METTLNIATNPLFGVCIGLVLGALAVGGKFSLAAANSLLVFAAVIAAFGIFNTKLPDYRLTISAIAAVAICCLLLSYWIEPKPFAESGSVTHTSSTAKAIPQPATLKQLFDNSWPDLVAFYDVAPVKRDGATVGTVAWRLNGDFGAHSKFLAFFIDPSLPPTDAAFICSTTADGLLPNFPALISRVG